MESFDLSETDDQRPEPADRQAAAKGSTMNTNTPAVAASESSPAVAPEPIAVAAASSTPVALLVNREPPRQAETSPSDVDGLPTETAAHEPILWRWSEVAPEGRPVHSDWDEPLDIDGPRIDQWAQNVKAMSDAGRPAYVTTAHVWNDDKSFFREPKGDETLAHVARVKRDGGRVWALTGYYGPESLKLAARNKFSVAIAANMKDGAGHAYPGETIHHISSTPRGAYYGTGTIKVAASAGSPPGTPAVTVPVYDVGATPAARRFTVNNPYLRAFGPLATSTNPYLAAFGG